MDVKRTPKGYRVGETHHRAKYSDETVKEARRLHDEGVSYLGIEIALGVNWRTVADWVRRDTRWNV